MAEYILIGAMAVAVVGLLFFRSNSAIVFLALCAGSVLVQSTGTNLSLLAGTFGNGRAVSGSIVNIAALVSPALICAIMLRGQVAKAKSVFNIVPAFAVVSLAVLSVVPLLSNNVQSTIGASDTWSLLTQYQEIIMACGLLTSIIAVIATVRSPHHEGKGLHKKGHH